MIEKLKRLILSLLLCHGTGIINIFILSEQTLKRPDFYPPQWIFAPIWLIIYTLMAVALYLVWNHIKVRNIFIFHLLFNGMWSILFFKYHLISWALIDLIIIWLFAIYLMFKFYKIRKNAGVLLFPYLLWLTFVGILNYILLTLN